MSDDINIGAITEALNDKTDRDMRNIDTVSGADAVIEYQVPTSYNNYTWYRLYKSGWVEQGGAFATVYNDYHDESVVLPITMSNSNYTCLISISAGGNARYSAQVDSKTTAGFTVHHLTNITAYAAGWQVSGMAAN